MCVCVREIEKVRGVYLFTTRCNTLHVATHWNTLQHTATYYSMLQRTVCVRERESERRILFSNVCVCGSKVI